MIPLCPQKWPRIESGIVVPRRYRGLYAPSEESAFDPSAIGADLLVWCDASQLVGLSEDEEVDEFTDFSGNDRHFLGSTTTRPLYKAAGINGHPALQSDGTDDVMELAAFGAQTNWWAWIVWRTTGAIASPGELWSIVAYPETLTRYKLLETDSATSINFNTGFGAAYSPGATIATSTTYAYIIEGGPTYLNLYTDGGVTKTSSPTGSGDSTGSRDNFLTRIFKRGDGIPIAALIGELAIVTGSRSQTTSAIFTYLSGKWGTSVP